MEQRTEVAVATELSLVKRALGVVVLLGGMMLFSWLMAGTAHADAPDRPRAATTREILAACPTLLESRADRISGWM